MDTWISCVFDLLKIGSINLMLSCAKFESLAVATWFVGSSFLRTLFDGFATPTLYPLPPPTLLSFMKDFGWYVVISYRCLL